MTMTDSSPETGTTMPGKTYANLVGKNHGKIRIIRFNYSQDLYLSQAIGLQTRAGAPWLAGQSIMIESTWLEGRVGPEI